MTDPDWEKLYRAVVVPGVIGLIVGAIGGIVQERYGGWKQWVRGLLSAILLAVLVGLWAKSSDLPQLMQWCIIGACAFVASDLLDAIRQLSAMVKTDPFAFVKRLREAFRGGNNNGS